MVDRCMYTHMGMIEDDYGAWVPYDDYKGLHDTLTFILTCDQDLLMSEGMDRVRAVLKLADGK